MGNLTKTRQKFTMILAALGVVDLLLVIYLLLPGSSLAAKLVQEKNLDDQVKTLTAEVAPMQDIDKKLAQTRVDVKKFYEQKVPSQFSQISQHLEKLMQETGVSTNTGIHYQDKNEQQKDKNDLPDVRRVSIETTVTGEYSKVAKFINAMEQDKFVFVIDQISLTSQDGGVVSLQIKAETFLRES